MSRQDRAKLAVVSLAGRVTRADTAAPIAGATIAIDLRDEGVQPIVVATDRDGAWRAVGLAPGAYAITAAADGFVPASHALAIAAPGAQIAKLDLALAPGGTRVHGTIADLGGGPIAGARVAAWLGDGAKVVAIADAAGAYRMTLPEGDCSLRAAHEDYVAQERRILVAGAPIAVDFELAPAGAIRGIVVARDTGQPVANARVSASAIGTISSWGLAHTDDDGAFVLRGLGPGIVRIDAIAVGYASANSAVLAHAAGESIDGVRVVVDRAYTVSGRVVAKGKASVAGAFSYMQPARVPNRFLGARGETGDDGAFAIDGARPGAYRLQIGGSNEYGSATVAIAIVDRDLAGIVVEVEPLAHRAVHGRVSPPVAGAIVSLGNERATTDAAGAFAIEALGIAATVYARAPDGRTGTVPVGSGENLVVPLGPGAAVAGRVVDERGAPVAGARIDARHLEAYGEGFTERDVRTAFADAQGAFRIAGLQPGTLALAATDRVADERPPPEHDVRVEVTAGATRTDIALTIDAHDNSLRGRVVDAAGAPVADAWVRALHDASWGEHDAIAATGTDGTFALRGLRSGTYVVAATGPRGTSKGEVRDARANGPAIEIVLAPLGSLSGRVTRGGAPVRAFALACGPFDQIEYTAARGDGSYAVEHVEPGTYSCQVAADGARATADVQIGTGPAMLDFALERSVTIAGTAVDARTGAPLADVPVHLPGASEARAELIERTDAAGHFELVDAPAAGAVSFGMSWRDLGTFPYDAHDDARIELGRLRIASPYTREHGTLGATFDPQCHIIGIANGSPAARAGLRVDDTIVAIDGIPIGPPTDSQMSAGVAAAVLSENIAPGDTVALRLARGATLSITAD